MIRFNNIKIPVTVDETTLLDSFCKKTGIQKSDIAEYRIHKKSIDARDKTDVCYVYSLDVSFTRPIKKLRWKHTEKISASVASDAKPLAFTGVAQRPLVVGSGPAGMFAALTLAEAGLRPIICERGQNVERRKNDVQTFWNGGELLPESNVQFGEGGAGTFSDGKLTTGIRDAACIKILNEFAASGAPEEILYISKPHIGTDKLYNVVTNLRRKIISLGGEYRFGTKLTGLTVADGALTGVELDCGGECYSLSTSSVILAIGHSARDTYKMLHRHGLDMKQKPFSIGVRIEHLQQAIDFSQYGSFAPHLNCGSSLGAADYKLSVHLKDRSVYTFCMCPGGEVIAAASTHGELVTNGMSRYKRDSLNANSAVLVNVTPNDFDSSHPLAGMYLQAEIEKSAFILGGRNFHAPIQLVGDFLLNRPTPATWDFTASEVKPTYIPGVTPADLSKCLPPFVTEAIREALPLFDKKIKGFAAPDAILTGVETRSSSPVTMLRDSSLQSNIRGMYPCGEGAGHAGGIMSAAADGIKCAAALINTLRH